MGTFNPSKSVIEIEDQKLREQNIKKKKNLHLRKPGISSICFNRAVALSHPRRNFFSSSLVDLHHQEALWCLLKFCPTWPALQLMFHFQGPADFLVHEPHQEDFPGNPLLFPVLFSNCYKIAMSWYFEEKRDVDKYSQLGINIGTSIPSVCNLLKFLS